MDKYDEINHARASWKSLMAQLATRGISLSKNPKVLTKAQDLRLNDDYVSRRNRAAIEVIFGKKKP